MIIGPLFKALLILGSFLQAEFGAGPSAEEYDWSDGPQPLSEAEKKDLIRQMIRTNILSEVAIFHAGHGPAYYADLPLPLQFVLLATA